MLLMREQHSVPPFPAERTAEPPAQAEQLHGCLRSSSTKVMRPGSSNSPPAHAAADCPAPEEKDLDLQALQTACCPGQCPQQLPHPQQQMGQTVTKSMTPRCAGTSHCLCWAASPLTAGTGRMVRHILLCQTPLQLTADTVQLTFQQAEPWGGQEPSWPQNERSSMRCQLQACGES